MGSRGRRRKTQYYTSKSAQDCLFFSELYSILDPPIRHLILDEAQYMKNWETATHQSIKALHYAKLLAVTGTPFQNTFGMQVAGPALPN